MELPEANTGLQRALDGYQEEAEVIKTKLDNDDVPPGKKAKIDFRLRDIETRLIPGVICRMQSSP